MVSVARQEMKASKLCVNAACSLITVEHHMPTHHHSKCYLQPHYHSKYSLKPKARMYLAGLEILVLGTSTVGNGDRDSRTLGRGQNLIGARESFARCVHLCSLHLLFVPFSDKECVTSSHIIVPQSISSTVSLSNLCQEETSLESLGEK